MSGPLVALNGGRVIRATISFPLYGTWAADLELALTSTVNPEDTLTAADLTLTCAVVRAHSFAGSRSVRVVGGYGGWRTTIAAKGYSNPGGVPTAMVLGDAASECGEQWGSGELSTYASGNVGNAYVRHMAPAARVLRLVAGPLWWMDPSGVTRLAPRLGTPITSQFEVISWSGGKGQFEVATETLSDWMPGRSFTSPTVTASQTIAATAVTVDNKGTLRVHVLTTSAQFS